MSDLLTTKEAGQELGISSRQVTYLIQDGKLEASRIGWQWVIERSELERYKQSRQAEQKPGRK